MAFKKTSFSPTKLLLSFSLCVASTVSFTAPAAAACQAGSTCVLPVMEAPPAPPPPAPPPPMIYDEGGGMSWWPFLLGLAALAGLILLLDPFGGDEDPISP